MSDWTVVLLCFTPSILVAAGIGSLLLRDLIDGRVKERRQARELRRLRERYEGVDEEEVEQRAIEGFCRYLGDMADTVLEIRSLPETPEPKRGLAL